MRAGVVIWRCDVGGCGAGAAGGVDGCNELCDGSVEVGDDEVRNVLEVHGGGHLGCCC